MKLDIHPTYHADAKVVCACGNSVTIGSTNENLEGEVCSACHPFYTGGSKVIDTAGRVEKFKARTAAASELKTKKGTVKKTAEDKK